MKRFIMVLFFAIDFLFSNGQQWLLTGNSGTSPTTNFIGTTDYNSWVIRTNNSERIRVLNQGGRVGIGTSTPIGQLHIIGRDFSISRYDATIVVEGGSYYRAGAIYWSKDNCARCENHMFIGGPTTSFGHEGSYFINLRNNFDSTTYTQLAVMQIYGNSNSGEPPVRDVRFYRQVLVDTGVGIGTLFPTAQLHTTSTVRFQGVSAQTENSSDTKAMTMDANGYVHWRTYNSGNLSNSCLSTNYLLKYSGGNASTCSLIYDNGSSIGIGTASPRQYTGSGSSILGNPTNPTNSKLDVAGLIYCNSLVASSDSRFKTNINPIQNALDKIVRLNGITYNWNQEKYPNKNFDGLLQAGFIAQDVEGVYPQAVVIDNEGYYGLNYNTFIPLLAQSIKEMNAKVDVETQKNNYLTKQIQLLQDEIANLCSNGCLRYNSLDSSNSSLYQLSNRPNPFNEETIIEYTLQKAVKTVSIMIYNLQGTAIKSYPMNANSGKACLLANLNDMPSGVYLYTLIVDGRGVATNRMILSK